jgi:hypothetical protein
MSLRPGRTAATSSVWRRLPPGFGFAIGASTGALVIILAFFGSSTAKVLRSIRILFASVRRGASRPRVLFERAAALASRDSVAGSMP